MGGGNEYAQDREAVRVVVLVPEGRPAPRLLLRAVERKRLPACVVHDAPAVLAELAVRPCRAVIVCEAEMRRDLDELAAVVACYHPRVPLWEYAADEATPAIRKLSTTRPRRAAPPPRSEQPRPRADADEPTRVVDAASRVERHTEWAAGPRLRLAGVDGEGGEDDRPERVSPEQRRRRAAGARERLAQIVHRARVEAGVEAEGSDANKAEAPPRPAPPVSHRDEPLISQEELAMLLGSPDDGDPEPSRAVGDTGPL